MVLGRAGLAEAARDRIQDLEAKWSRFLPTSEVSTLNRYPGHARHVSPDTLHACRRATRAHVITEGRFNPLLGRLLTEFGYDRSFEAIDPRPLRTLPVVDPAAVLAIDKHAGTVTVPDGHHLDLGGLGKGLAADLVSDELIDVGAEGVLVNLGGDLRVRGTGPTDGGWSIGVENPLDPDVELLRVRLDDGAVASSGSGRRRWAQGGQHRHHLLGPDGTCVDNGVAGVAVLGAEACAAEVAATDVFVAGPDQALARLAAHGVDGVLVRTDGSQIRSSALLAAG